jgi:hypothetical protein
MAQSYHNADELIRTLVDYIDQTDKKTILYVFGDHLPPLTFADEVMNLDNVYEKYATTLLAYSNYKDIAFADDYITPNLLAAQIVLDAGIQHSGYWDYIAQFGEDYPTLHKQVVDVDDSIFDTYKLLQYDIMFGKQYLVE